MWLGLPQRPSGPPPSIKLKPVCESAWIRVGKQSAGVFLKSGGIECFKSCQGNEKRGCVSHTGVLEKICLLVALWYMSHATIMDW